VPLRKARIPQVEHLEIWFGPGGHVDAALVGDLLARSDLPALRRLGLRRARFADDICRLLGSSPLAGQLTHLDLSGGRMTDEGAGALAAHREAFARLAELDVSMTDLSPDGLERVAACAAERVVV